MEKNLHHMMQALFIAEFLLPSANRRKERYNIRLRQRFVKIDTLAVYQADGGGFGWYTQYFEYRIAVYAVAPLYLDAFATSFPKRSI